VSILCPITRSIASEGEYIQDVAVVLPLTVDPAVVEPPEETTVNC
jgi:hypothetical protein